MRSAVKQLFELVRDDEAGFWRIESTSAAVVTVAGVQIQKVQPKQAKKKKDSKPSLPLAVYLDASKPTTIVFGDIVIRLWLVRSPGELLRSGRGPKQPSL